MGSWQGEAKKLYDRNYWLTHKEQCRKHGKKHRNFLKGMAMWYYSGGKQGCVVCGESRLPCLSLDHIDDDGAEKRRAGEASGNALYRWLRQNNYPEGYQTMCMNCQYAKRHKWYIENGRPSIHRAGDRVMIQKGKRLIETVIPELDADGYAVYDD